MKQLDTKLNSIFINSKDRNIKNYKTFDYNIEFGANSSSDFFIDRSFKNIKSISIDEIVINNFYCDLSEIHGFKQSELVNINSGSNQKFSRVVHFERLNDLPYLILKIDGIQSNTYGTDKLLNNANAILIADNEKCPYKDNSGSISYSNSTLYEQGNYGNNLIPDNKNHTIVYKNINKIRKKTLINP